MFRRAVEMVINEIFFINNLDKFYYDRWSKGGTRGNVTVHSINDSDISVSVVDGKYYLWLGALTFLKTK